MILTDGAWGTQLQARGLDFGDCPDEWNLTHPDEVAAVAASYVDAGSEIILTNTFRASRIPLAGYGLADKVTAINKMGVALSKRGAAGRAKVFASIGPSGKMLASGEVSAEGLRESFTEQAGALAEAGADGLVVETMSDPDEACIAVAAAKATGLLVVGCMVYDTGRGKDRTMMGTTPEQSVTFRDTYLRLLPLLHFTYSAINPVAVKSLMTAVGLPAGDLRRPLSGLKPDHLAKGIAIIQALGLDRRYGWRLAGGALPLAAE